MYLRRFICKNKKYSFECVIWFPLIKSFIDYFYLFLYKKSHIEVWITWLFMNYYITIHGEDELHQIYVGNVAYSQPFDQLMLSSSHTRSECNGLLNSFLAWSHIGKLISSGLKQKGVMFVVNVSSNGFKVPTAFKQPNYSSLIFI